jgi:hypothetical protein
MAKHNDSVNRIPGRNIAGLMPRSNRCQHQRSRLIGCPEGASKHDQIGHRRSMTARRTSSLVDQFWKRSCPAPTRDRAKAKGPRGPLQISPAAIAVIAGPVDSRAIIAGRPIISGAVIRRRRTVVSIIRTPETATPSVADHTDLLYVRDLRCRRCRRNGHGRRRRRCRDGTEQGRGDEANLKIHVLFLCLRNTGYRSCSDQIVAEPKCNADEQIFSWLACRRTSSGLSPWPMPASSQILSS